MVHAQLRLQPHCRFRVLSPTGFSFALSLALLACDYAGFTLTWSVTSLIQHASHMLLRSVQLACQLL
ncbi:hypothetical protein I7I53_07532 [Histoplasma capsulatum var. duboisii H88]|uniref:Uncharacterized protein n=1 Tax=Ajellomyces capsulatus (strain H88) TaxID=544711 RepID=A0A8A1LHU4_AJEC8|nr:hypothetical protein I7I53_07532 [Histoplasma capsulatum var. duboisii H88]